jgi:hypothetical protein
MAMPETTTAPGETTTAPGETTTASYEAPATGRTRWASRTRARSAPPSNGGAVYGLGMIGALVYFIGRSESGQDYLLAIGKAVVWPAILVYKAFQTLDR